MKYDFNCSSQNPNLVKLSSCLSKLSRCIWNNKSKFSKIIGLLKIPLNCEVGSDKSLRKPKWDQLHFLLPVPPFDSIWSRNCTNFGFSQLTRVRGWNLRDYTARVSLHLWLFELFYYLVFIFIGNELSSLLLAARVFGLDGLWVAISWLSLETLPLVQRPSYWAGFQLLQVAIWPTTFFVSFSLMLTNCKWLKV